MASRKGLDKISDDKMQKAAEAEAEAQRISKATARAEAVLAGLFEWIAKTDGRTGFLFAVNTALGGIALGAANLSDWSFFNVIVLAVYFVFFAVVSFHLIMVQYPNVTSPNRSMLFFGTISGQSFDDFVEKFSSMKDEEYLRDLLHQCHVNSKIVQAKFRRIQSAMSLLILSSLIWAPLVAGPSLSTPAAQAFLKQFFEPHNVPLAQPSALRPANSP